MVVGVRADVEGGNAPSRLWVDFGSDPDSGSESLRDRG